MLNCTVDKKCPGILPVVYRFTVSGVNATAGIAWEEYREGSAASTQLEWLARVDQPGASSF
jgi:hypothetical protein